MTGWLKLKLMGLITFINAAIGVTLGGLLYTIWPDHYFKWYPSIPIFYWVMAIVMTYILDRKKRKNGDVTITAFMVVRFCNSQGPRLPGYLAQRLYCERGRPRYPRDQYHSRHDRYVAVSG